MLSSLQDGQLKVDENWTYTYLTEEAVSLLGHSCSVSHSESLTDCSLHEPCLHSGMAAAQCARYEVKPALTH